MLELYYQCASNFHCIILVDFHYFSPESVYKSVHKDTNVEKERCKEKPPENMKENTLMLLQHVKASP